MLQIEGLRIAYKTNRGPVRAVDRIDMTVAPGTVLGVVGESGCGKTTAVRSILGVMPSNAVVEEGRMLWDGRDLLTMSKAELNRVRWRDIAYIPQSAMNSLDPCYRVGTQLEEVLCDRGGMGRTAARARSGELFDMVGLARGRLRDYPHQFSGGMRQRAAIALALALKPKLIIADEPVTALDVVIQRQILDVINDLQAQLNLSVILVTHDISVVAYTCDRVAVMYAGRIVETGPVRAVLTAPTHPYTMGLCNAFPDLAAAAHRLAPIEGAPPDLADPPTGCRFAPRCPFRTAACADDPRLVVADAHHVACWRASEAAQLRSQASDSRIWEAMA